MLTSALAFTLALALALARALPRALALAMALFDKVTMPDLSEGEVIGIEEESAKLAFSATSFDSRDCSCASDCNS